MFLISMQKVINFFSHAMAVRIVEKITTKLRSSYVKDGIKRLNYNTQINVTSVCSRDRLYQFSLLAQAHKVAFFTA